MMRLVTFGLLALFGFVAAVAIVDAVADSKYDEGKHGTDAWRHQQ